MSELNLPKGYLSYSSMDLWRKDPEGYRRRYYEGEPWFSTPYTEFGNEVGDALEFRKWDAPCLAPVVGKVPQLSSPEHNIEVEIAGVPVLSKLDDFDPKTLEILEYKTGIRNKGKAPWDRLKVRKHKQLTIYTLMVANKYGDYNPDIRLVWMETKWSTVCRELPFGNQVLEECGPGLKLTGHVEEFHREIKQWELDRQEEIIRETAEQISEDYTQWKNQKHTPKNK